MGDEQFHDYVVQVTGEPPKCPNTGDLFEDNQDAMQRHPGQASA